MGGTRNAGARDAEGVWIRGIRRALLAWYRRERRALPWRATADPYAVWVSEVMLQQTRVEVVIPYYRRFLDAFPTVGALARARPARVLKLFEGLGYYGRALNLHRAARRVVGEREGRLPETAADWRTLPGVGEYTAGAVASIAFGERVAAVDGNARRVVARWLGLSGPGAEGRVREAARRLVPRASPGDFNQAVMELGARLCLPRRPRCRACPVRNRCRARAQGREEAVPARPRRRAVPHHEAVAAVLWEGGRFLAGRRPTGGLLGGLWEFPGGRVEAGETDAQALARELREELGVEAEVGAPAGSVEHAYSHFTVTIRLYACRILRGRPRARFHTALRWVGSAAMGRLALPAATRRLLEGLRADPGGGARGGKGGALPH